MYAHTFVFCRIRALVLQGYLFWINYSRLLRATSLVLSSSMNSGRQGSLFHYNDTRPSAPPPYKELLVCRCSFYLPGVERCHSAPLETKPGLQFQCKILGASGTDLQLSLAGASWDKASTPNPTLQLISLPWLSSFAWKHFNMLAWQSRIWVGLAAGEA